MSITPRRIGGILYRLDDRNRAIGEMFSDIAPRYDFLNRLLSLGADRRWRREAVSEMVPAAGGRHLDVATGTADMALEIVRQKGAAAAVAGADISVEMMRIGREKCRRAGAGERRGRVTTPPRGGGRVTTASPDYTVSKGRQAEGKHTKKQWLAEHDRSQSVAVQG